MAFDLKKQAKLAEVEEAGIDVPVKHSTGEPVLRADGKTQATIRVVGSHSKRYRKLEHEARGRARHKDAATLKNERAETDEQTGAREFREQREFIANCCLGWDSDGFTDGDVPMEFSAENVARVFDADATIQAQITVAIDNHANFFAKSSTA